MAAYGEYGGKSPYAGGPWEQQGRPQEDQYNEGGFPPYAAAGDEYYEGGEPGGEYYEGAAAGYGDQGYYYGEEQDRYAATPGDGRVPYDAPPQQFAYGERQAPRGMPPGEGQAPYGEPRAAYGGEEQIPYGMQPTGYGAQLGEAQTPYGMRPGEEQMAYTVPPGDGQIPYGMQPGEEQFPYDMQPGEEQFPYDMQPGAEQFPYGAQPGDEQMPYGMPPIDGQLPYGMQQGAGMQPGVRPIPGLKLRNRDYDEDGSVMITPPSSANRFLRKDDAVAPSNLPQPPFAAMEHNSVGSPRMRPYGGGAAAGYAESRRFSVGTESLPPYPSTSAAYAASKPVTIKDRYNPAGTLGKEYERGYQSARGRGSRGGCRRCCCISLILLVLLAGGLAAAFFFIFKQPEFRFVGVEAGQPNFANDQLRFTLPLAIRVGVKNPNPLGVDFNKVEGEARFKDISNTVVGSGKLDNVVVPRNSDQVIRFPFLINYEPTNDPGSRILLYIARQCGILGGPKGKLEIDYTLRFSLTGLDAVGIKPAFSSTLSFDCPLDGTRGASLFAGLPRTGGP